MRGFKFVLRLQLQRLQCFLLCEMSRQVALCLLCLETRESAGAAESTRDLLLARLRHDATTASDSVPYVDCHFKYGTHFTLSRHICVPYQYGTVRLSRGLELGGRLALSTVGALGTSSQGYWYLEGSPLELVRVPLRLAAGAAVVIHRCHDAALDRDTLRTLCLGTSAIILLIN